MVTLEQLALLHTAREHLPKDIVEILKLLGKTDNMPFNQLYSLAKTVPITIIQR